MGVHLGTEGSGDVLRTVHILSALIVQTQYTGIPLPSLSTSCRKGCMDILCQKAIAVAFGDHTSRHKGLLLHSGLGAQGACHIVQIPNLVPLVGGERHGCRTLPLPSQAGLYLKGLPELGRQGLVPL